ncbi:MAG: bifunctional demethylmenaquinone methyltransferase/2-methoxy-6-polyprenyl-1,4-benzoquinol methylase UbiE [Lentisphaeria bacterium]|nr:bifunctional demethylmenaquinone methyltransferase/2-methoxy-6-polyprenyl-1,4-benzoquinol methylase UbiE [Lentisphaeria bacterium]NQZ71117.1 bifunctional demethylmenaquinone methyltransferase/2-methoxy-6-polyprenyl-1,4-benzoquinol methylase UbiE [Lentisphaeria bacterium]
MTTKEKQSDSYEHVGPSRNKAPAMFDRISGTYDLLNHLLSCGIDVMWRKRLARKLKNKKLDVIVDLATGTGDQILTLLKLYPEIQYAYGIDMSFGMLSVGQEKVKEKNLDSKIKMIHGDALAIPIASNSVDAVSISFGIRNVINVEDALAEMQRIVKPGGSVLILEFGIPKSSIIKFGYLLYFRKILPFIGSIISGDKKAYGYLNQTVESFPYGTDFKDLMTKAGFSTVEADSLSFGIAYIYHGQKNVDS